MTALKGKHILVTGGAGFVGSHIVDLLLQAGCDRVIVVDNMVRGRIGNLASSLGDPRLNVVQADIRDAGLMRRLLDGIDIVYHQAALRITHCAAEPDQALQVMVQATQTLMDQCVEKKVEKVIYASTASVYGLADSFPTEETHHPYNNRTLYGAAKVFGEGLLRSYNDMYGLNYVALRYFNVYGPRMDLHGRYTEVLVRWMERLESGAAPIIFGDGLQTMDMIHVTDVARANILAAEAPVSDVVLNVASQTETSLLDLAHGLGRAMGRPDLKPVHQAARAVNPVPRRLGSARLAAALIGFRAQVPLDDGLRGLVDWWREEQAATLPQEATS